MATPPGRGAISIVRISGRGAAKICEALTGAVPRARHAALCDFRGGDGEVIDRGLVLYFPSPHSYTGEDSLELHAHGSPVAVHMLLARCFALGARAARPGEFSERAFLNGRIDLAQAEAVADLIESSTEAAARSAVQSLQGEFSARVKTLTAALTELRVQVEAEIDFPDEEIEPLGARAEPQLHALQKSFDELQAAAARGQVLRDGFKIALTGAPNAGKSSLLNALAGRARAIVSAIPGTTRDVLEQTIDLGGVPVEIADTAGMRAATDEIEKEGMRRAREAQTHADLILWVVDDSVDGETETEIETETKTAAEAHAQTCIVRNKIDLSGRAPGATEDGAAISAKTGAGLDALREIIQNHAGMRAGESGTFSARARHLDALRRARAHLDSGAQQLHHAELFAEELSACQRALGEITGEVGADELLGIIFSSFCIGK